MLVLIGFYPESSCYHRRILNLISLIDYRTPSRIAYLAYPFQSLHR